MAKTVEYTIVKAEDISLAMKASAGAIVAEGKSKKSNEVVWNQTVCTIMERIDLDDVARDTSKDGIKKLGAHLKNIMAEHIELATVIPLQGRNREGATFDVKDPDGIIKWSSWSETRRIWDYLGSVAKIIAFGKEELLYPESMKVGSRCEVLKECKDAVDPLKEIDRLSEQLQSNLDVMKDKADVLHAHKAVSALMVNNLDPVLEATDLINKVDALMEHMDDDEQNQVRTALTILTKYFTTKAA